MRCQFHTISTFRDVKGSTKTVAINGFHQQFNQALDKKNNISFIGRVWRSAYKLRYFYFTVTPVFGGKNSYLSKLWCYHLLRTFLRGFPAVGGRLSLCSFHTKLSLHEPRWGGGMVGATENGVRVDEFLSTVTQVTVKGVRFKIGRYNHTFQEYFRLSMHNANSIYIWLVHL